VTAETPPIYTLLVIEIGRPEIGHGDLGPALLHQWPEYLAFAVSFLYVGVIWLNHHALFASMAALMSAAWLPVFPYLHHHPDLLVVSSEAHLFRAQRSRPWVGVISFGAAALIGYLISPAFGLRFSARYALTGFACQLVSFMFSEARPLPTSYRDQSFRELV
jgi:hypothetical protein